MLIMRRQNNSCDQCRKAKRACDAVPLAPVRSSSPRSGQEQSAIRPCSYCYKTKKHCTRYWACSQSYTYNTSARKRGQPNRRRDHDLRTNKPLGTADTSATGPSAGLFNITQGPAGYHQDLLWWNLDASDVVPGGDDLSGAVQLTGALYSMAESDITPAFDDSPTRQTEIPSSIDTFFDAYTENNLEEAAATAFNPTASDFSHTYQNAGHSSIDSFCGLEEGSQAAFEATNRCQSPPDWTQISGVSLSPFSPQHVMTSRTHNNFISQNLMHVYHDVFEHNLSCWVSEETCPYKMLMRNRNESLNTSLICPNPNIFFETAPVQREWGDVWSNRIYTRVIKLDRAAQVAGMIQLTRSDDQAASKALHLSIMAFSAQWAQNSRRERKQYSPSACESQEIDLDDESTQEFDRQIQRSLWWQARKALDDSSELECYRVVCAELIFGLTQKPWDRADTNQQGRPTRNVSIVTQIQNLLSRDGPPIFLERAVRKAYTLKYAMDTSAAAMNQPGRTRFGQSAFEQHMSISTQDRQTIGFIYWLVVMFDTVSASMNQRPVVVADRDCQHDATEDTISVEQGSDDRSTTRCSDQRWVIHLFIQDDPKSPTKPLRWPCHYDAAARAITRSGPVKILLYRHLHYLQDAIQRGYRGELIEEIIRNAVLVYRYWNTTYGVFFRDLIQNYGSIPPRIQSWSFCILAHWHLATLILADLLEWADKAGLGDLHASQVRAASATVENIRRASADELADLARIVTPTRGMAPPPQLPGFHSAVNQATILTEPWTAITIRAFSKAFLWHFDKAQPENQGVDVLSYVGQDVQRSISQCADCVKALWQLGKKSDMALTIAETLASALAGLEQ